MISRAFKLFKYITEFVYYKSILKSEKYNEVIYQAVKELGGIYIKLIQFVCLRTEIFSNKDKIKFLSFYDAAPFETMNVLNILRDELGKDKYKYLKNISQQPFASGTFGQVYEGNLIDDTKIIIKIKRKNLMMKLKFDFFILKLAACIFNLFYYQRIVNVNKLVNEFENITFRELDYENEARNAQFFYKIYKNHPYVYIPRTYLELCTDKVLIQEYVGGISVTQLIRVKDKDMQNNNYDLWLKENYQTDMQFILKNLAYELFSQGLFHEKFYADPHPGNIKILPNNRYALIDFGIVGYSPKNKRNYYQIISLLVEKAASLNMKSLGKEFLEWGAGDFFKCIKVLDEHFSNDNNKLLEAITTKYSVLLEEKREHFRQIEVEEQENFAKMYLDILQAGQNLKVKIPEGLLAMMRTIAIYKSWNVFLEPNLHHMRETYKQVLNKVDANKLLNVGEITEKPVNLEHSIEKILDWVENIAEFDLPFYNKLCLELRQISYV